MLIDIIAGARPNFMKIAALYAVAPQFPTLSLRFIHTGQHYDLNMSDVFLQELALPQPAAHLGVGSGSHAAQTAAIMQGYEACIRETRPHLTLVVGDVNSTIACALVAAKEGIAVAHVEAGLRSFDRTMPEEINRVLTDSISDWLFVTEPTGLQNLAREGRPAERVHLVGHVMIDTLLRMLPKAAALTPYAACGAAPRDYAYVTLHRPSNVDDVETLRALVDQIAWVAERLTVIFPTHPRTRAKLSALGWAAPARVHLIEPVSYLESLALTQNARVVITDSGGLQEESTALRVPCLTLRHNTERPITLTEGTNTLIGHDWDKLRACVVDVLADAYPLPSAPVPYWDGRAGERILRVLSGG
jgi:UDP-N-acetylglucosamine 2-epimerase (non-hydrolysing)